MLGCRARFVDADDGAWLEWWCLDGHDVADMAAEHHDGVAGCLELGLGFGTFGGVHHAFDGAEGQEVLGEDAQLGDGSGRHKIILGAVGFLVAQDLGAFADDGDIGKWERVDDVLQKGALFGDALDQRDGGSRPQDGQDQTGDTGAATDVEHPFGRFGPEWQVGHGVEQVFADHLHGVGDSRQVELFVPLLEHGQVGIELDVLGVADGEFVLGRICGEDGKIVLHAGLRYSP